MPGVLLGAAYVTAIVLPWWGVLPDGVWSTFAAGLARLSWMTLAAALLAVRLSYGWATRLAPRGWRGTDELVALPLVLTTFVALDAGRRGLDELSWNTALLGGLAIALLGLAWSSAPAASTGCTCPTCCASTASRLRACSRFPAAFRRTSGPGRRSRPGAT